MRLKKRTYLVYFTFNCVSLMLLEGSLKESCPEYSLWLSVHDWWAVVDSLYWAVRKQYPGWCWTMAPRYQEQGRSTAKRCLEQSQIELYLHTIHERVQYVDLQSSAVWGQTGNPCLASGSLATPFPMTQSKISRVRSRLPDNCNCDSWLVNIPNFSKLDNSDTVTGILRL